MNWLDADIIPPNKEHPILVVDSWNMAEWDVDAHKEDEGADNMIILSYRVAWYDFEEGKWWCSSDQRVRFKWYIPLQLPEALKKVGFENDGESTIRREHSWLYAPGSTKYIESQQKVNQMSN